MKQSKEEALVLYKKMLELRLTDLALGPLKLKDLVMDGYHPYDGEEAVAVGVSSHLRKEDYVASTHRPQGHSLAKGSSVRSIFCEMLGRIGGPSDGLGGPMQWIDAERRFFCGSIVGSGVSYSTGFGLAAQTEGKGNICVCYFGDGASNTGSFHEGLNLASIWKLPIVFVCENNQYAEAMPVRDFVPIERISSRAGSYGIPGVTVDGMDVLAVLETAGKAIEDARFGNGPTLIEAVTYRFRGHYLGDPLNYRTESEVEDWRLRDPLARLRSQLEIGWKVSSSELAAIDEEMERSVNADRDWALAQPKPTLDRATANVLIPVAGRSA